MQIAYGIDVKPRGDPWVALLDKALDWVTRAVQLDGLIFDIFPICAYFLVPTPRQMA